MVHVIVAGLCVQVGILEENGPNCCSSALLIIIDHDWVGIRQIIIDKELL